MHGGWKEVHVSKSSVHERKAREGIFMDFNSMWGDKGDGRFQIFSTSKKWMSNPKGVQWILQQVRVLKTTKTPSYLIQTTVAM